MHSTTRPLGVTAARQHFSSSDSAASPTGQHTLTSGTGSFNVTLKTAGSQTVTAADTVTSSIQGVSGSITVSARRPRTLASARGDRHRRNGQQLHRDGARFVQQTRATGYPGTVNFSSSDTAAVWRSTAP